jgi:ubiquinone/menaquinone biosynthesis C-methylase UbiE
MSSRPYFDRVARRWDSMRSGFFSEVVRERALDALGVAPGELAADLGAGTGFMTDELLARGLDVIAVDESEAMLAQLRDNFPGASVECRLGDASALPLADASVDHAVANMYLHHVAHPAASIAEMARVVRPGGGIAVTDLQEHEFEFLRTEHHDRWLGFALSDLEAWFEAAGLDEIQVGPLGTTCDATSSGGKVPASINIVLACARNPSA